MARKIKLYATNSFFHDSNIPWVSSVPYCVVSKVPNRTTGDYTFFSFCLPSHFSPYTKGKSYLPHSLVTAQNWLSHHKSLLTWNNVGLSKIANSLSSMEENNLMTTINRPVSKCLEKCYLLHSLSWNFCSGLLVQNS